MNYTANINATDVVFPAPLVSGEKLKLAVECPVCDQSRFTADLTPKAVRVRCAECDNLWSAEPTNKPLTIPVGTTAPRGQKDEDIMSKASKSRKGNQKKSAAVDALLAEKKETAGKKPETKTIKKSETKAGGAKMDAKSFKCGDVSKLREGSNGRVIAEAFGKGKTVADAVEKLKEDFKPGRSKAYEDNPRAFIVGYVSHLAKNGFLTEV